MQKLLDKYAAEPSIANARKIVAYNHKHMMAACCLSPLYAALFNDAIRVAANAGE